MVLLYFLENIKNIAEIKTERFLTRLFIKEDRNEKTT